MEHHHFSMVIYRTSFPWPWTTGKNIRAEVFRSMPGDLQLLVAYGQFWLLKPTLWAMYVYIYIYWKNIATGSHKNVKIQRTQTWRFSKCCCLISILHFSEFQSWCLLRVVHLPLPSWARLGLRRWTLFRSEQFVATSKTTETINW